MNPNKLFLAIVIALISPITLSAHDFEVDGIYYNVLDETNNTVAVTHEGYMYSAKYFGDVTIPSLVTYNGNTYSVTRIDNSAFISCTRLTSITIPNSVTTIENNAFKNCSRLTKLTIEDGAETLSLGYNEYDVCDDDLHECHTIDKAPFNDSPLESLYLGRNISDNTYYKSPPFYNKKTLKSVTIGNSVTTIGDYAFYSCSGLTSVSIGNSVTSIEGNAFSACSGLTSVSIGNSVTTIGDYTFYGCRSLTEVNIPNSVTTIGDYAFDSCSGLTSITIPNSVITIGKSAFSDCSGLTIIKVDSGNSVYDSRDNCNAIIRTSTNELIIGCKNTIIPNSVTSIGSSAFENCSGLTSVTIPNSVTSIGDDAFENCSGLTSVTIPNSVITIGNNAFYGCTGLTEVNISDLSAWCKIDFRYGYSNPLNYAKKLKLNGSEIKDLVTPKDITEIKKYAFDGCSGLTSVTIGNSVTTIGGCAFSECTGLTSVTIGNSVTTIGDYAFSECTGLTKLSIEDGTKTLSLGNNGSNEGLFYDCPLDSLYLGRNISYNTDREYGYSPFYNKTTLKSVTIGNSVTTIGDYAFDSCSGLTSVTIPNSVTSIGGDAFDSCSGLTSVTIPNSVTSIGGDAFYGCTGLTSVSLGNSVTSIGIRAFSGCSGLTSVTIPNSVTSIGGDAFYGCTGLTSVSLGNSVTSIGNYAFSECTGLTSIIIPNSVTTIENNAFKGCNNLKRIVNFSKLILSKGSTDYGYIAYYANSVINVPNAFIDGDFVWSKADNVNKLVAYIGNDNELILPSDFNGENYIIGTEAFYGYSGLTSVSIPNSVSEIGDGAFNGCKGLTKLTIEDGTNTLSLGYNESNSSGTGEGLFYDCPLNTLYLGRNISHDTSKEYGYSPFYSISSVTIGNSVTEIEDYTFYGCKRLTSVTIPNSVTTIGDYTFYGCRSLTEVNIPNSVTSIGESALNGCTGLTKLIIEDGTELLTLNNYLLNDCPLNSLYLGRNISYNTSPFMNKTTLINVNIGNFVTEICSSTFSECTGLTEVSLGNSITKIGYNAFMSCHLSSLTIPNSVKAIGSRAFYGCNRLTSITIGESVTSIDEEAFGDCTRLNKVNISDISSWCNINFGDIYANPLYYADNLNLNGSEIKELIIPNSIANIKQYAFINCKNITTVSIGNSVTEIGTSAFYNCSGLSEVNISDLSAWCKINFGNSSANPLYYAHKLKLNRTEIKELIIPNSVANIKQYAFINCENLTTVSIGNSVTEIGTSAFEGCKGVTSVTIPRSVNKINNKAFYNCAIRLIIAYPMTPPTCADGAFNGSYSALLKVPEGTDVKYAIADEWYKFDKIQEIAGVENVMIDNVAVKIAIENGNITINGIENPQVEVYSLNGNCVYCGNDTIIPISTGVYILRINGKSYKIAIK